MEKSKYLIIPLLVLFLSYLLFFNRLEPTKIGISRNYLTGETTKLDPGIYFSGPWVVVYRIRTHPIRMSITSSSKHFSEVRLVQFNPDNWEDFVKTEGFYNYWLANRISFNFGYSEEYRGIKDILRAYTFSEEKYSFLKILDE